MKNELYVFDVKKWYMCYLKNTVYDEILDLQLKSCVQFVSVFH